MTIFLTIVVIIFTVFLILLYSIYSNVFKGDERRLDNINNLPKGAKFEPFKDFMSIVLAKILKSDFEEIEIQSFDNLKLVGRYYFLKENAPLILYFHGYRGNSYNDIIGIFDICEKLGYNLLVVNQRAHGKSQGKSITFGVSERYDVVSWTNYCVSKFGDDVKIILVGLSMGASTILMASNLKLQSNVKGIIADCGFSSPKAILEEVISKDKYKFKSFTYFLVRLSAIIYGKFDPNSVSASEALKETKLPVLFIHGKKDNFVPTRMSVENYESCASKKYILLVENAEHGMSYHHDKKAYIDMFKNFCEEILN